MNDLEKFRRHMGKGKHFNFGETGQEEGFFFEPLGTDDLPDFLIWYETIAKVMSDARIKIEPRIQELVASGVSRDEAYKQVPVDISMPSTAYKTGVQLCTKMVLRACPDLAKPENKVVVDGFVSKNFLQLVPILAELNGVTGSESSDKLDKIEAMKARVANAKS